MISLYGKHGIVPRVPKGCQSAENPKQEDETALQGQAQGRSSLSLRLIPCHEETLLYFAGPEPPLPLMVPLALSHCCHLFPPLKSCKAPF